MTPNSGAPAAIEAEDDASTDRLLARIAGRAAAHDRDASFPADNLRELGAAGLLGLSVPPALGGGGAGLVEAARFIRRLGAACASTALITAMTLIYAELAGRGHGWDPDLRARVLRGVAREGALINALNVEPALGTPSRGGLPATVAQRDGGDLVLSGRKIYATGSPGLTWMLVRARLDDPGPRGAIVLVPAASPGIDTIESWDQLGLRASASHDVTFDRVRVPASHAIAATAGPAGTVADPIFMAWNTVLIAALYTGVAEAARTWLVRFLNDRVPANLGHPLSGLPRVQEAVGRMEARLLASRRLIDGAAADADRAAAGGGDWPPATDYPLVKTIAAENAIRAVEEALTLTGNHGLARDNPLERHLRDVFCARIHTPQEDTALTAAGRAALGISPPA